MEQILKELHEQKLIPTIIERISGGRENEDDMKDLEQDVYVILLEKGEKFVKQLYEEGTLRYYIANVIYTQIRSQTSPYFIKYKKFRNITDDIDNI